MLSTNQSALTLNISNNISIASQHTKEETSPIDLTNFAVEIAHQSIQELPLQPAPTSPSAGITEDMPLSAYRVNSARLQKPGFAMPAGHFKAIKWPEGTSAPTLLET